MIKKLNLKFIVITMGALLFLLASILITTNIIMDRNNDNHLHEVLFDIADNDGVLLQPSLDPTLHSQPPQGAQDVVIYFSVKIDFNGNVIEFIDSRSNIGIETAEELAEKALKENKDSGVVDQMRYLIVDKNYGKIIVLADQSIQNRMLIELRTTSYLIGCISIAVLFVIVYFLSRLAVKPIEVAFEKQKKFISDSGHELKTPLSILSVNADMMELEMGENKWLTQIKQQSKRMNKLIHELLTLAKTEDIKAVVQFAPFNLSQTIINTVLPFEVIAYEQGKNIECKTPDDIFYNGSEENIKEMLEALMDNAMKYSDKDTAISVALSVKGSKKIIEVQNQGQQITEKEKDKLFEKFYRADDSRARATGGHGLGLSIVKNIVDMHNSKIEIDSKSGESNIFRIILNDK